LSKAMAFFGKWNGFHFTHQTKIICDVSR